MASTVLTGSRATRPRTDSFQPVEQTLRAAVIDHYRRTGERLDPPAWLNTLETNSGHVVRRGRPMVEMLCTGMGLASLHGLRLLDAGCGFGALAVYFAAQGAEVVGIDPTALRLEVGREAAAQHVLPVTLLRGRMEALEFPDRSFDVVVMNNSLCYLVDRGQRLEAIGEARRVLRPGGRLLIRNPSRLVLRDQFSGLPLVHLLPPDAARRVFRALGRNRSYVRLRTASGARRELRRGGFAPAEVLRSPASRLPVGLHRLAHYQHLLGIRPADD
jgi:SAM-dependent methyltransferase